MRWDSKKNHDNDDYEGNLWGYWLSFYGTDGRFSIMVCFKKLFLLSEYLVSGYHLKYFFFFSLKDIIKDCRWMMTKEMMT